MEYAIVGGVALVTLICGFVMGVRAERTNWLITGRQGRRYGRTPHHCDGGFYYVIPEAEFVSEYQLRPEPLFRSPDPQ